jgi:hypothetical protein
MNLSFEAGCPYLTAYHIDQRKEEFFRIMEGLLNDEIKSDNGQHVIHMDHEEEAQP